MEIVWKLSNPKISLLEEKKTYLWLCIIISIFTKLSVILVNENTQDDDDNIDDSIKMLMLFSAGWLKDKFWHPTSC